MPHTLLLALALLLPRALPAQLGSQRRSGSTATLHPAFGNGRVLVDWERAGRPLGPERGMAQLLVPGDDRRGRSLHQIARIAVVDPERPAP